jgi:hypothetical protein
MTHSTHSPKILSTLAAALLLAAGSAWAIDIPVTLTGELEVPPVKTAATAKGFFSVSNDKAVAGSITTTGMAGTAAHIHEGAPGMNGPVIIPLVKNGDTYSVAPGAKLTDPQNASLLAGNLYVNVHSAANPGGELRAQLKR